MAGLSDIENLEQAAHLLGFPLFGVTSASKYREHSRREIQFFETWLTENHHGEMDYLARGLEKRRAVQSILAEAQSVLCFGYPYRATKQRSVDNLERPWISQYALGRDYHKVMKEKLEAFVAKAKGILGREFLSRIYIDTGPILERHLASLSGLGWVGKNSSLISRKWGSYLFVGEVITDLELSESNGSEPDRCGKCQKCIEACPTGAILEPYKIDARRCIAYLTIEHRGDIAPELSAKIGNNLFGCDVCQEVCPWNQETPLSELSVNDELLNTDLGRLAVMSEGDFERKFEDSPLRRARFSGFQRNLGIVQKNLASSRRIPQK